MKDKFFYLQALHFLNDGFGAALLLFLPFMAVDLRLNLVQVGSLGTGLNLLAIFLALPSAFLANKFGSFKIILWAALIYSLGYLAVAGAYSYWYLLFVFVATGSGFGLFHPIAFSLVARWSEPGRLGRRIGNFTAWGDAGRIVITGVITFIIAAWGWRLTSVAYGALATLVVGYIYFCHFQKNFLPAHVPQTSKQKIGLLLKDYKFIFATLTAAMDNLASAPLFLFLPFLLISKNISTAFLGSFAAAFLLGNMFGKAIFGLWADKFGNVSVFITAELLMALLVIFLTLVQALWLIVIISVALGIVTRGTVTPTRAMINQSVARSQNYENANSLAELVIMIMGTAAPFLLGVLSNAWGIGAAFRWWSIFAVVAVIPALLFKNFGTTT